MKQADEVLDTSGLVCPLPLLKTKQALGQLKPGQILKVISTDPSSVIDFKVFTEVTTHKLLQTEQQNTYYYFLIEKA